MFEGMQAWAAVAVQSLRERVIRQLAAKPLPPGVKAQASEQGIILSGRHLRRRMMDDPRLRNFGQ